jgi:adenosylmethionine---8-amino-7-oxononanoate aminotransferase
LLRTVLTKPDWGFIRLAAYNGYHGDTFAAISVCDPVTGMHHLFDQVVQKHYFAPTPQTGFDQEWD